MAVQKEKVSTLKDLHFSRCFLIQNFKKMIILLYVNLQARKFFLCLNITKYMQKRGI